MLDAPVVLIADEDWASMNQLTGQLGDHLYLVLARNSGEVTRYARKFRPDVILLCESLRYGKGGPERLVSVLLSESEAKVIVLTESVQAPGLHQWLGRGASDCLPHPTKSTKRIAHLGRRILELAASKRGEGGTESGHGGSSPEGAESGG